MRCPNCGRGVEGGWNYCPNCGARFRRDFFSSIFDRMFSSMDRELREMDRMMEKNIEALDISPFFGQARSAQNHQRGRPFRAPIKPQGSGFSIRIKRSGRDPPRVSVRTFGNVDRERIREQIQSQLGFRGMDKAKRIPKWSMSYAKGPPEEVAQQESLHKEPKSVHEPRTEVRRLGDMVAVDLEMPGVKSLKDIDIKELESSIEVRAVAGDKAYFKILTKPGQFRLAKRAFSEGILHLEFS